MDHVEDAKQLLVCKQEWSPSLDQEDPELSHIKVEPEKVWTSQEGEQLQGLNETDIKIIIIESEDYKEEPSPQSVSSDQSETKTEDSDDWKEPCLNTLKSGKRRRKRGFPPVTAGEDRRLSSSAVSQPITTSGSKPSRARSHSCQQCGKSFSSVSTLQKHQGFHTGEKPSHCLNKSGKRQRNQESISVTAVEDGRHPSSAVPHPITASGSKPSRARSHSCQQCGKSFTQLSSLHTHQRVHTGEKPYLCQQCGKSFSKLTDLQRHQRIHTGEKPYHCEQCGKNFTQLSTLTKHQRVHTGEKPYHCEQCGKNFTQLSSFRTHQRIHTGKKPYHCQQCGKSFSVLPYLQTHQRIHTGEKPYHCQQCGKSFGQLSNVKKHHRVHTGEKPYHCQQCGKNFRKSSSLKTHQRVHTGETL